MLDFVIHEPSAGRSVLDCMIRMRRTIRPSVILVLVGGVLWLATTSFRIQNTGVLEVRVKGAESSDGNLALLLFNSNQGFPSDAGKAIKNSVVKANGSIQSVYFYAVPFGTYAVTVLHDENGNGTLDTNLFGIPQEGVGVSNDALNTFGPPVFGEASFYLGEGKKTIEIKLDYW